MYSPHDRHEQEEQAADPEQGLLRQGLVLSDGQLDGAHRVGIIGVKDPEAEDIVAARQVGIADGAAGHILQHCLIFGKAHQLIPGAQIGRTGKGQGGKVNGHALG